MTNNRSIGFLFGILGGIFIILEGLVDFVRSAFYLALGHPLFAWVVFSASVLFVILGIVLAGFALLGRSRGKERAVACGVVMVVLALLGIVILGFANGILGLLGAIFVLIGGIFYILTG
jgi:hypothetical protein